MEGSEITEQVAEKAGEDLSVKKKIFVAGATGSTGKRIVEQLLAKGFAVKAAVRDLDKARTTLSSSNHPSLQIVSLVFLFLFHYVATIGQFNLNPAFKYQVVYRSDLYNIQVFF